MTTFRDSVGGALRDSGVPLDAARSEGARLFNGKARDEVLTLLETRTLAGLAPQAEQQAHVAFARLLADLGALRQQSTGDGFASEADFDAALQSALRQQGLRPEAIDQELTFLFHGNPGAYKHFMAHLDAMPGGARLAAYTRCAQALMDLQRLRQWVN